MAHALTLCLYDLLDSRAREFPDRPAVIAPNQEPLTYSRLLECVDDIISALSSLGIGRNDRVAVVLPNGPEMAVTFLAVASGMTCTPLNPAYQAGEFDFYLSDLGAKAVIVARGSDSSVIDAANSRGIVVIEIDSLVRRSTFDVQRSTFAGPGDTALVLHTSGTTSRPKIVPLTQANICISAHNIAASLELTPDDRCLNIMPLFHIHGLIGALLASLTAGGSVVCTPGFFATDFFDWMAEFRPTWYTAVPTMHQAILSRASGKECPLRFIRSCSSALPPKLLADLESEFGVPVIEAYGMTEAAHQMAGNPLPPRERKPGSVGIAAGPEVAIMDETGCLLPSGSTGEIVVQGPNVTPGYENNPDANASAFADSWFRTGDQGYLDQDGYLFITGRIKELINRAGEKISPREIDEALLNHPAVAQAIAFAVPHPRLGEDLAAAVVPRENAVITEREIREFMASRLADFKVPSQVVILDEIPKGPTGKPQRIGLAERLGLTATPEVKAAFVLPRTPLETELASIWADVLGLERIGILDNFFHLGGDSMLATRLIARIRDQYRVELPLISLFESPTIAAQAQAITEESHCTPAIPKRLPPDLPLSSAQERLWFLDQLEPGSCAYTRPSNIRLKGPLNLEALESALNEIIRRHECIRASFISEAGRPVQLVHPDLPLELSPIDVPSEDAAREMAVEEAHRPFDLTNDPMVRAKLLRLGDEDHILLLTFHHIVFDGWSHAVLLRELGALYGAFLDGKPSPLPEPPIRYADYALWQKEWLQGDVLEEQLSYWRQQLSGNLPVLDLPADHPRPPIQTFNGACHELAIPESLIESLKQLGHRHDSTLFMTMLAAFKVLLHRYTGETDLIVGLPIAGRTRAETEGLIGLFVNTLVMRTDLSGNPAFEDLLAHIRRNSLGAFAHQDLPFERLVEELQPQRNLSRTPIFQVMFNFDSVPMPEVRAGGLHIEAVDYDTGIARFDLCLEILERNGEFVCRFEYNTDLFEAPTIERMAGHFRNLLEGIARNPDRRVSELPVLSEPERHQLLVEWNDTEADYPRDKCMHQLFEAQVEKTPDSTAVVFQDQTLTYRELDRRANQLARYLQSLGVRPEVPVGIHVERSLDMMVGLLGILKAGGAYVPLDPDYPQERLAYMMEQAGVRIAVTQQGRALPRQKAKLVCLDSDWGAICSQSPERLHTTVSPENLAYIIFTSGSTGRPKGVQICHRSAANLVDFVQKEMRLAEGDVLVAVASLSFDVSVSDLFPALMTGGTVVVASREATRDGASLQQLLVESGAVVLNATPSTWRMLIESGWTGCDGLKILCGAEAMSRELADQLLSRGKEVWNLYGPTETTVWSTSCRVRHGKENIAIGRPIANTQVYILDQHLNPVPIGVPGELYVGGDGLARGYIGRPELTAERFVPNPFVPGSRMYKTGDLTRYLRDGSIEFLGRFDNQVKIRGFRIELGEIEGVLVRHPAVTAAVVKVWGDDPMEKHLAAYVVPADGGVSAGELREFLARDLPDYMIPAAFIALDSLPLTPSAKIDRKALPPPDAATDTLTQAYAAPRTPLEKVLALAWAEVLGLERVGIHDDFFALGGHSLLATRLTARLRDILQTELPVRAVFEHPTAEGLAESIERESEDAIRIAQLIIGLEGLSEEEARSLLEADHA